MNWLILSILTFIFAYTPFKRGLFFSTDIYLYACLLCFGFVIWMVVTLLRKQRTFPKIYLWLFALPFVYYLTFTVAESPSYNFDNLLSWLAYVSFFFLLLGARSTKKVEELLPYVFGAVGIVIAFFALFGVWDWTSYRDVVLGDRTTGPFQYANTFAAVIGAYWVYSLVVLTRKQISWYTVCLFSLPLVAYGVGFFHSYSRGAFLVIPVVWLVGLFCMRVREQLVYLFYTIISVVASLLVFRNMVGQEQAQASNPGLVAFIVATVLVIGVGMLLYYAKRKTLLEKLCLRRFAKPYYRYVIPVLAVVVAVAVWMDLQSQGVVYRQLPASFQERIQNINVETGSALARTNMYEDAWKISKDAPLLGLGGDGWKTLYTSYQSSPYMSNEIHNGYLEVLLNTGWLGLLLFAIAFAFLFGQVIHQVWARRDSEEQPWSLAVLLALLVLFVHAAIDFDFSYGSVWFTIFWLLAMGVGVAERPAWPAFLKIKADRMLNVKQRAVVGRSLQVVVVLGVLVGGVYALRFYTAQTAVAAVGRSIDVNEGIRVFSDATSKNHYNVDYWISLANVRGYLYNNTHSEADRQEAVDALAQAEKLEPHNPSTLYKIANIYGAMNAYDQAVAYLDKAIAKDPYNVVFYDALFKNQYLWMQQQLAQNDGNEKSNDLAAGIVKDYETYLKWYNEWKSVAVPDKRSLVIEDQSHYIAGDAYQVLQQYAKALDVFKSRGVAIDPALLNADQSEPLDKPFQVLSLTNMIASHTNDIVILSAKDDAYSHLSANSKEALGKLGTHISELGYRGSYIAVFSGGKVVFDQVNNDGSIEVNADSAPELKDVFGGKPFSLLSAGFNAGNRSSILIDDVEYSKNGRGINIAVFDQAMNPIGSDNFDTFLSDMKAVPLGE